MPNKSTVPSEQWETIGRREVFSARPWLSVERHHVRLPTGLELDDFYQVRLPEFAIVVAKTTENKLVMVRGYKHGPGRMVLSPPAGMLNPAERPIDGARRELLEETGFGGGNWRALGDFVADGNRRCGVMHLFFADQVARVTDPQEDDSEPLDVELMDADDVLQALSAGEMPTMAAAGAIGIALALAMRGGNDSNAADQTQHQAA